MLLPAEPDRLRGALEATQWNKTQAAELLQWSRMTVFRKMAKYRINPELKKIDGFGTD